MRNLFFIAFLFTGTLLFAAHTNSPAKKDSIQKTRILSVGAGFIKTSLNYYKNAQENTYFTGHGFRLMFQPNETFRVAANFSTVNSVNIQPTWLNVRNNFYDLDAHFMMHFMDKRNIAYFIMGASAQYWNGFYTGLVDYNQFKLNAPANKVYESWYYGAKIGMGVEIKVYGPISGYGEFIFRVSNTDVGAGISDVVYGLGLKMNLANLAKDPKRRHSILSFGDKYHWF